jgi:hypothetical protein
VENLQTQLVKRRGHDLAVVDDGHVRPAWKLEIAIEDVVPMCGGRLAVLAGAVPVVNGYLLHRVGIFRMRRRRRTGWMSGSVCMSDDPVENDGEKKL